MKLTMAFYLKTLLLCTFFFGMTGCSDMPTLGHKDNQLTLCSNKPNCVCSFDDREKFNIAPFTYDEKLFTVAQINEKLTNILKKMPRMQILQTESGYIRVVATTLLLRFKDDVELLILPGTVHVRSASRLGYSDFSVNRERVELIRTQFNKSISQMPHTRTP